ncbi:hypothetical protein E2542_SST08056 [Spatholobus suberectus]|nr:hypothetical protein E2542_SST08056 [Spatholobus suberectus]
MLQNWSAEELGKAESAPPRDIAAPQRDPSHYCDTFARFSVGAPVSTARLHRNRRTIRRCAPPRSPADAALFLRESPIPQSFISTAPPPSTTSRPPPPRASPVTQTSDAPSSSSIAAAMQASPSEHRHGFV